MGSAAYPASVPTTPPATLPMGPATACLAGQALIVLSLALLDTGELTVSSLASVTMVEPASRRMGAVSALQAGLDPDA